MDTNLINTTNLTTIFMAPTLGHPISLLRSNGFLAAFSSIPEREFNPDCIYLLFDSEFVAFSPFLKKEYQLSSLIVEDFNYKDKFVIVVYALRNEFKEDFDKIRQGEYSKTSKGFQELFPKEIEIIKNGERVKTKSIQYKIFNKTKDLRGYWEEKLDINFSLDQELWEVYDKEKETLKL